MTDSLSDIKTKALEDRLRGLYQEYEAANAEYARSRSEVDRIRIQRQIDDLEHDIETAEEQLRPLLSDKQKRAASTFGSATALGCVAIVALAALVGVVLLLTRLSQDTKQSTMPLPKEQAVPTTPYGLIAPEQFIVRYYQLVDQRQYDVTWTLLTPEFQRIGSNGSREDYVRWWDSVAYTDVGEQTLLDVSDDAATVYVNLIYHLKDGRIVPDPKPRIGLLYDSQRGTWLINTKGQ